MGKLLLIAVRNLRQNTKRTLMLGSAIAFVTVMLVLLTSVSNGIQDTMLRAATTLSTGHVNIGGFFKVTSGQAAPVVTNYKQLKEIAAAAVPQNKIIVDRLRGWGKLVSTNTSIQVGISGVDVEAERDLHDVLTILKGDLLQLKRPGTVLLFQKQADKLAVNVGDTLTISAPTVRGANNAVDVEVVAIAKDMGLLSSFNIFTPKQTVRDIYLLDADTTGAIQIYLHDPKQSDRIAEKLRRTLGDKKYPMMDAQADPFWMKFPIVTREAWTGQKLDVTTWADEMAMLTWIVTAFDGLTGVVVGILMVIIVIGLMNTLWMTIRERTREVGTLRAIGMPKSRVMLMFLLEACLLSSVATIAGAILGSIVSASLDAIGITLSEGFSVFLMNDTLRLVVEPTSVLLGLLGIVSVTTLFAIYPAYRAARMRPVTAIHQVG